MIEIDECHRSLIVGLIRSVKPYMVLELGYGTGLTTKAITYSLNKNQRGNLIVVDNFLDWDHQKPESFVVNNFTFVEADERQYLESTDKHFDLIVCDADHNKTDQHIELLLNCLNKNGYLIFHDITNPMFPNLGSILQQIPGGFLFQESSVEGEECYRGLYIYQKR